MKPDNLRGMVLRCPICGAEITVLARKVGDFSPRCCNVPMVRVQDKLMFYVCPVCGAEIGVINRTQSVFEPRCCNTSMQPDAA